MSPRAALPTALRSCAAGWAWLALLWAASRQLAQLAPWPWRGALVLLAALPAWGLWLGYMLRKRLAHAQFSRQGWLARWWSGGLWAAVRASVLALALCGAALWQGWFLATWEWALLAAGPPLHAALVHLLQPRLAPQFAAPAYAWRFGQWLARASLALLLGAAWLAGWAHGGLDGRDLIPAMQPQALDAALAGIAAAPSGLVRWGLDALLTLQVGSGAAVALPHSPALRIALLALAGPLGVLWCLGWALQGASASRSVLWTGAQGVAPAGRRAAATAAVAALATLIALQTTALLDGLASRHASPLALQRLPECERIGEHYYSVGTLAAVRQLAQGALGGAGAAPALCGAAPAVRAAGEAALERYLDWYFSLGAEWGRIYHLLRGGPETFLQERLERTLADSPELSAWTQALRRQAGRSEAALEQGARQVDEVLARHHLATDGGRCRVLAQVPELPELALLGDARRRLAASAALGLGASSFAAVVAAKAMGKVGMKSAAKVLAMAAAKQAAGKAGGAGIGALAGAGIGSVVPGLGTAAGAAVGSVIGLATGVAIDWAALRAEEMLTREDMRAQLRAALAEQMTAVQSVLACPAASE